MNTELEARPASQKWHRRNRPRAGFGSYASRQPSHPHATAQGTWAPTMTIRIVRKGFASVVMGQADNFTRGLPPPVKGWHVDCFKAIPLATEHAYKAHTIVAPTSAN